LWQFYAAHKEQILRQYGLLFLLNHKRMQHRERVGASGNEVDWDNGYKAAYEVSHLAEIAKEVKKT
jgi:hypothetical protein